MSFQEEIKQAEERLKEGFKNHLNGYYQWEEDSQEALLESIYGEEEEEEEEELTTE